MDRPNLDLLPEVDVQRIAWLSGVDGASRLRRLDDPTLDVIAPSLIDLEVINSAARRRGMTERELLGVVHRLQSITITRIDHAA